MTPVQEAIAKSEMRLAIELERALIRCSTYEQKRQCIHAYGKVGRALQDQIGQQYGLPPMLVRDPR